MRLTSHAMRQRCRATPLLLLLRMRQQRPSRPRVSTKTAQAVALEVLLGAPLKSHCNHHLNDLWRSCALPGLASNARQVIFFSAQTSVYIHIAKSNWQNPFYTVLVLHPAEAELQQWGTSAMLI